MGAGTAGSTWLALTARTRTCRLLAVFTRIERRAIASSGRHPNLKKRASIDAYLDQSRSNSFDSLN